MLRTLLLCSFDAEATTVRGRGSFLGGDELAEARCDRHAHIYAM